MQADNEEPSVFNDIRVLELTGVIGQQCGKLFADMGADVIKVEPIDGAESRRVGPYLGDAPHPDRSLSFWQHNTNKRSISLDLRSPSGTAIFRRLVSTADVLLECFQGRCRRSTSATSGCGS